ncbi:hypothetical protein D3C76_1515440 [compost metagenome]
MFPLLARPLMQQTHTGLGNGFEGLLDLRVVRPVQAARPAHIELAGFAEPGQPALLA